MKHFLLAALAMPASLLWMPTVLALPPATATPPPRFAPPPSGKTRTEIVRDASGKIVAKVTLVGYPNGVSVTTRDASGKLTGTAYLPLPTMR